MLQSIRYILTIAANERSMLYRTPKFWVLAILGGGFTLIAMVATTIISIVDNNPDAEFMLEGTDAWIALYFFSYIQTIIIIFVAADFRKAEQQVHLDQVMLSQPMTTANWVIGKYLGIISGLLILNGICLGLSTIGRGVKAFILGVNFNILPALEYFAIATLPSILFMTGLVFFLISLLRVQALAIIIPLGYAAAILFSVEHQYEGLLDYGCFAAPLFYSDLIGFGDIETLLWQRVFYTLLGIGFLCGSIVLYPRLRQNIWSHRMAQASMVVCLSGAAMVGISIWENHTAENLNRQNARTYQAGWADHPMVRIKHYDFDISLQNEDVPLRGTTRMVLQNPYTEPLDTLVFSLNGALEIQQAHTKDGMVAYDQWHQLVIVDMGRTPLQPGAVDTLTLAYAGDIDPDAYMVDRLPGDSGLIPKGQNGPPWTLGNVSAWVSDEFTVLPAQVGWYPVPGVAAGYAFDAPRPSNFATATLRVQASSDIKIVTQGTRRDEQSEGDRVSTTFDITTPTPAFSINAGPYEKLSHQFSQTEVEVYFYKGHLMEYEVFSDVADTCFQTVERMFELYETVTGVPYPYPKLSLVEVPLQMQVYTTQHGVENVLLQPGVIMIDELQFAGKRFEKIIERETRNARRRGRDDSEWRIKRNVFVRTILSALMPDQSRIDGSLYTPIRNYYHFQMDLAHPILYRALELQLHEAAERLTRDTFFPERRDKGMSTNDELRRNAGSIQWVLQRRYDLEIDSVMATLEHVALTDLRPEDKGNKYRAVLDFKSAPVMDMLQDWAGREAYRSALDTLQAGYQYKRVGMENFMDILQTKSPVDIPSFVDQWFNRTTFPGYRITRAEVEKWDTGQMEIAYQTKVRVQNGEEGDGFVRVELKTRRDQISRPLALGSFEEKEMYIVTKDMPERVQVVPFFARNRGRIMKPIVMGRRLYKGAPNDTIFTVQSSRDSLDFIVDDLDEGFLIPSIAEGKYLRPPARTRSWQQWMNPQAYGRYIFGSQFRWESDGDFPVRWETSVPRSGDYELSMHMPGGRDPIARRFNLVVTAADGQHEVTINPQGTKSEWWPLGRFSFVQEQSAVVELSDKGKGFILADAIRWTYVK